jgi:hypothetical protein
MRNSWLFFIGFLGLRLFVGMEPAHAVCTNPDGVAGSIVFNKDHQVMQYCNDTNWRQIGSGPNCSNIGETCTDGSIYAGLSPDGNAPMYTTPADAPSLMTWNDSSENWVDTAMVNCTGTSSPGTAASCQTGEANTTFLVGLSGSGTPAPYVAAEYCDDLTAHGQSDWYLPAQDELYVLFTIH